MEEKRMACILYLVIPCYNEEEVLPDTAGKLDLKRKQLVEKHLISEKSRICFVDDGSKDGTWMLIEQLCKSREGIVGIRLSRNRGHQNAVLAGMMAVKRECQAVITLDADLQDDIHVIDNMVEAWQKGAEIVYGVRSSRKKDSCLKRDTALIYYGLLEKMGVEIVYNHADYRLMSRRALDALEKFEEVNLFLRGIVPLLGFQTETVYYERKERLLGESKYPLRKMIALAVDGITSFSIKPMRWIGFLGGILLLFSVLLGIHMLISCMMGQSLCWQKGIFVSLWAVGGLQLAAAGILGEYIGKTYMETKKRPRYFIEKRIG